MRRRFLAALVVFAASVTAASAAPVTATAFLDGGSFIQSGSVTNTSAGLDIVEIIYSLGAAADGIATWEDFVEAPAGFVRSDALGDGAHYQTISWSGLSIAPGASFNFGGLDIDQIVTLVPLDVTGGVLDFVGTTLAHASLTAVFSDGRSASASLLQQSWSLNQNLTLGEREVPEPVTLSLLGLGMAALGARKFRRA